MDTINDLLNDITDFRQSTPRWNQALDKLRGEISRLDKPDRLDRLLAWRQNLSASVYYSVQNTKGNGWYFQDISKVELGPFDTGREAIDAGIEFETEGG